MKLLYDVLRRCILYLNRCVAASSAAVVGAPRDSVPFSLKPILVNMEWGRYVGPILLGPLMELLTGRQATCDRPQAAAAAVSVVAGAEVLATAVAVAAVAEAAGKLILGWEMMGGARRCGRRTMHTCLLCLFRTGRTRGPSWWVRSSQYTLHKCQFLQIMRPCRVVGGVSSRRVR